VECFLENGTKVDSTRDRNQPLVFEVGAKQVIEGLEVAIQRLSVRQLVEVVIPHLYAYGMRGRLPEIPPKSTLVVRLELLAINPAG
jgi:peptidylprolyl isomerase